MSQTTEKRSRFAHLGDWVAELVLVFVGVSAAFWLSNYQQHRQDAERRDQILASIEQTLRQGIESSKVNRAKEQEPEAAEFRRALDADEMPPVRPFTFITDYRSEEHTSELQSQSNLVCRLLLEKKKKKYSKILTRQINKSYI